MTPEGKVKQAIKKLLNKYPQYSFWPVQTGYGKRTLDVLICVAGNFCAIEAKAPGKQLTKLQQQTAREIHAAGGEVFVIDNVKGLEPLEQWLDASTGKYQTQTTGSAGGTGGAKPISGCEGGPVQWQDVPPASSLDPRSLLVEETWIRCPEPDPDALQLSGQSAPVRGTKKNVQPAHDEPAGVRSKQHGDGED